MMHFAWMLDVAQLLILAGILLGFIRLAKGPTLPDRIVALDMMTISLVAFSAIFAVQTSNSAFLDIVVVLALIGFVATVAMARFSERFLRQTTPEDAPSNEDTP
jgi:multicomponent Na+:H+ antiporter subunit F